MKKTAEEKQGWDAEGFRRNYEHRKHAKEAPLPT
jgi:hypothetical protein